MVSSDTGKLGIITRAKNQSSAVVIRYADLRSGIRAAMSDAAQEKKVLATLKTALEQKSEDPALTPYARDDAQKSLEALECFHLMRNQLAGFDYQLPHQA